MTTIATQPVRQVRYATGAQWWEAIGRVPLDRVVFDPPPGTATEADVVRLDDHDDRLCELVDGTLVEKTMGSEESAVTMTIAFLLGAFARPKRLGVLTGEAGMVRTVGKRVRMPDVAFFRRNRLPGGKLRGPITDQVPDLAVEVLSKKNTRREMEIKLREYFEAGAQLVWCVDPKKQTVDVYVSPEEVTHLTAAETLTGGEVLPGFSVVVGELFEGA